MIAVSYRKKYVRAGAMLYEQLVLLQIIASELSRVMLIAIEVAVEYWLALTWSPQAQWLSEVTKSGVIQDEVRYIWQH